MALYIYITCSLKEVLDENRVIILASHGQRSASMPILSIHIGPVLIDQHHQVKIPPSTGEMKRCEAVVVFTVHICPSSYQQLSNLRMVIQKSYM